MHTMLPEQAYLVQVIYGMEILLVQPNVLLIKISIFFYRNCLKEFATDINFSADFCVHNKSTTIIG